MKITLGTLFLWGEVINAWLTKGHLEVSQLRGQDLHSSLSILADWEVGKESGMVTSYPRAQRMPLVSFGWLEMRQPDNKHTKTIWNGTKTSFWVRREELPYKMSEVLVLVLGNVCFIAQGISVFILPLHPPSQFKASGPRLFLGP